MKVICMISLDPDGYNIEAAYNENSVLCCY
jgi:hypothetical protein